MPTTRTAKPRKAPRTYSGWTMQHRPASAGARRRGSRSAGGYLELSRTPLHVMLFLAPLIALYEIGSSMYLSDGRGFTETIRAHSILLGFFQDFGVAGRFLPGIAILTVLAVWHVLAGDRLRVRPWVIPAMALESLAWTIPLLVLLALVGDTTRSGHAAELMPCAAMPTDVLTSLPWQARGTISIGAGLYEELLFRMIGIAGLHLVLVDLGRLSNRTGSIIAVALTAAAFAAYHDPIGADGAIQWPRAIQLACAGAYFGGVYLGRGFGVVVAVHVLYDLFVLIVFAAGAGSGAGG
jgi:membrane protease YdiL (CAAX protease family)